MLGWLHLSHVIILFCFISFVCPKIDTKGCHGPKTLVIVHRAASFSVLRSEIFGQGI
uniref:Uncharacterized protein n=1 Tax=Rhizophora mucronata TaxID=61149 RepID=A0A2P2QSJ3_RHIMU